MIRWLLIILFIYLVYRLIQGPKRRKNPGIRFHFGKFRNFGKENEEKRSSSGRARLDDIEEAEFEDITEKSEKENKEEQE